MRAVLGVAATVVSLWGCAQTVAPKPDAGAPAEVALQVVTITPGAATPANADFVAFQDGAGGAWTPLTGAAGNYSFPVKDAAGRYNVVVVCPSVAGLRAVEILEETAAEEPSLQAKCNGVSATKVAVDAVSTGWGTGTSAATASVTGSNLSMTTQGVASSVSLLQPGVYDVLAFTSGPGSSTLEYLLNHGTSITGTTHLAFDFGSGAAPITESVTVAGGVSGETLSVVPSLITKLGGQYQMSFPASTPPTFSVPEVPPVLLDPADLYATSCNGLLGDSLRTVVSVSHTPQSGSFSLPTPLSGLSTVVAATSPALLIKAQWSGGISGSGALLAATQTNVQWLSFIGPAALAGATSFTPADPSSAAGWNAAWDLQPGISTSVAFITGTAAHSWVSSLLALVPVPSTGLTDGETLSVNQFNTTFTP